MNHSAIASWSGGKDGCLACFRALRQGHRIEFLLNFISRESGRCCFHGVEAEVLRLQAELMGIPLAQHQVTADMQEYEKEFKAAVSALKRKGPGAMVFGDIYLDEHREWVERVCRDLDITPVLPLWNDSPAGILEEFISLGFRAVVVSCQADKFGGDFVGRYVDRDLLRDLESANICPCGENGEFHTLVVAGPLFRGRIEILESEAVLKEGFWKYWFLDIKKYRGVWHEGVAK